MAKISLCGVISALRTLAHKNTHTHTDTDFTSALTISDLLLGSQVPSPLPEAYALAKTERARFLLRRELAAIPDRYHLNVGPLPEFMDTPLMSQHGVMTCGQLRGLLSLQRLVRPIWSVRSVRPPID